MIEIYLLEQFAAFQEYGTLSAAAEHLHISQPALSRSMKKLEEILDVELFTHTKNSLTLTDTGRLAADWARRILQEEEDMITSVRNYDRSLHTLSLGYCSRGAMMVYTSVIMSLYPGTSVSSDMESETDLIKGLLNKKYQLIFLSYIPDIPGICAFPCGSESLYLTVLPTHPAAACEKTGIRFRDINGETFLVATDIGIWEKVHRTMLPDSRMIREKDLDLLSEVVNSSSLPAFASSLSLRAFGPNYRSGRVPVPIMDPEATVRFYCVCLNENRERFKEWFDLTGPGKQPL